MHFAWNSWVGDTSKQYNMFAAFCDWFWSSGQKEQGIVPFVSHFWCMFHSVWQIWRQYICQQGSIRTKSQHTNIWGFGVNNELRKFHILRKAGHIQWSTQYIHMRSHWSEVEGVYTRILVFLTLGLTGWQKFGFGRKFQALVDSCFSHDGVHLKHCLICE